MAGLAFPYFVMAVGLLAAITLQAASALVPVRQAVGNFVSGIRSPSPGRYVPYVVLLYIPTFVLGAWIYVKYRTYVRIPMEQIGYWKTLGSFEFKEHVVSMGMAMLPAYWYFWRNPLSEKHSGVRRWLTLFLAFTVWYAFLVGHVANDFRGVGS